MAVADINRVGARVVWAIGARSDAFAFAIDDDRFNIQEVAAAIIEAEAEMVRWFAESHHPQRERFLQWLPEGGMNSGETIPEHLGQIEAVRIGSYESESEEDWEIADVTTATNIKLWSRHPDIFPNAEGYYHLTNQTLEFTGDKAQVKAVVYEPGYVESESESESGEWVLDRMFQGAALIQNSETVNYLTGAGMTADDVGKRIVAMGNPALSGTNPVLDSIITNALDSQVYTVDGAVGEAENAIAMFFRYVEIESANFPYLQIDDIWESALVSGAIINLAKLGVPPELIMHHTNKFAKAESQVRQGLHFSPEIDLADKL
ncbi:MAG: hypothetical protein KF855_03415 [Acidobacteria bacterium]|nr:hypothetical protein [Acidobacteriota bacterium]